MDVTVWILAMDDEVIAVYVDEATAHRAIALRVLAGEQTFGLNLNEFGVTTS